MGTNQKQSSRNSVIKGEWVEKLVSNWLVKQGLIFVESRFRVFEGEIDLIMREGDILVFIEVRYRKNGFYGTALETINYEKCRRIVKTAQYYLQQTNWVGECRFDIVVITGRNYEWIRNAFDAHGY